MCKRVVEENPRLLKYVPDRFKTKEICDKAVSHDPSSWQYTPDWFLTQQQLKIWHDDDYYCNDNELIKWRNGYQKRKAQKASIKEELLPLLGTHQDGGISVFLKTRKKRQKHCGHKQFF